MYYDNFDSGADVDGAPPAYWKGHDAFYQGFDIDDNPHENNSENHEHWFQGFVQASYEESCKNNRD